MDEILLVTEDQIERAVAMLISIEKTVVEGAGAAGWPPCWRRPNASRARTSAWS